MKRDAKRARDYFVAAPNYAGRFSTPRYTNLAEPLTELGIPLEQCVERSAVFRRVISTPGQTDLDVFVKIYSYAENPWRRFLRTPKVDIERQNLQEFAAAGIRVPNVVAWGCKRGWLGRPEHECLVTEAERDVVNGEDFFPPGGPIGTLQIACLRQLAQDLRRLHSRGRFHRDFWLRNILIRTLDGSRVQTIWIDSPRGTTTHLPYRRHRFRLRDLGLIGPLSEPGKDEFLSAYFGVPPGDPSIALWKQRIAAYLDRPGR